MPDETPVGEANPLRGVGHSHAGRLTDHDRAWPDAPCAAAPGDRAAVRIANGAVPRTVTPMTSYVPAELDFDPDDEAGLPEDTDDGFDRVYDYVPLVQPPLDRDPEQPETGQQPTLAGPVSTEGIPLALLEGLNPEQHDAVTTLSGPLLVIAGPGSGKTRVLVHRVAALLATGTWPSQVLAVTFTNKAAAEMRSRVAALTGQQTADRMWIATFHAACVRILRYHHEQAGLPRSFSIADSKDSQRLVVDVLDGQGLLTGLNPAERKSLVKDIHSTISNAKNAGQGPDDLARSPFPDIRLAAQVMAGYNARLNALGAVDFDDILLRTLHLLRTHPEVAAKYQQRFVHILVDEYQDTNKVQYDILTILTGHGAGDESSHRTGHGNLCVVGDADQSIYAFRGANPSNMAAFSTQFPSAKVVALGQNYRSTQRIVAVAQAVIDPNPAVHRAPLRTANDLGEHVRLCEADSNYAEARWVVAQIRARGGSPSAHAVLVRTNALTRALEQELAENRLPYQVVGALRFYDRAEVKDALAYLRLAANPKDGLAFERCVNTPRRGIGPTTVAAVTAEAAAAGSSVVDVLRLRATGKGVPAQKVRAFLDVFDAVVTAAASGPAVALTAVAGTAGLREHLRALTAKEGLSQSREENLDELISYATQFVTHGSATDAEARRIATLPGWEQTEAFLENVALVSAAETATGRDPEDAGQVSLLTMHAAKGKEFDHVYVVGLEDNICPHSRAINSGAAADLEEERRLLFVAVSRARDTLDLSFCRRRTAFGKETANPPSRFLSDLPADVDHVKPAGPFGTGRGFGPYGGYAPMTGPAAGRRPTPASAGPASGVVPATLKTAGPRLSTAEVSIGTRVRHTMLGEGTVCAADARTVTVDFGQGPRMLALDLAPLTVIA